MQVLTGVNNARLLAPLATRTFNRDDMEKRAPRPRGVGASQYLHFSWEKKKKRKRGWGKAAMGVRKHINKLIVESGTHQQHTSCFPREDGPGRTHLVRAKALQLTLTNNFPRSKRKLRFCWDCPCGSSETMPSTAHYLCYLSEQRDCRKRVLMSRLGAVSFTTRVKWWLRRCTSNDRKGTYIIQYYLQGCGFRASPFQQCPCTVFKQGLSN